MCLNISTMHADPSAGKKLEEKLIPRPPLSDEEFLANLYAGALSGFGHEAKIRAIYLLLQRETRSKESVEYILGRLAEVEKDNTHTTINYFWVHMVDYYMKVAAKASTKAPEAGKSIFSLLTFGVNTIEPPVELRAEANTTDSTEGRLPFSDFFRLPPCQALRNSLLYEKYYSRSVIDDVSSESAFVIPNLKQLPSVVL